MEGNRWASTAFSSPFLARVTNKGLVTDGVWYQTAQPGEEWVLIGLMPSELSPAEARARWRFNCPLWLIENGVEHKYLEKDSPCWPFGLIS